LATPASEERGQKFNQRLFYIDIGSMKITVKIVPSNASKEVTVKTGSTVSEVLKKMQLKPESFIVLLNNTPIPIDDCLNDDHNLTLLQVASGG